MWKAGNPFGLFVKVSEFNPEKILLKEKIVKMTTNYRRQAGMSTDGAGSVFGSGLRVFLFVPHLLKVVAGCPSTLL